MMNILITNDDGINACGLQLLAQKLQEKHNITVIAPDSQKSASSHSITLTKPIVVKEENIKGVEGKCYSVSGTPVDCTKLAITTLAKNKVDLVVSGINDGFNLGTDVLYSGTVSAAIEGAINMIPGIAVSCDGSIESYEIACKCISEVIDKIENKDIENIVLNINIPSVEKCNIKGIKVCNIGEMSYNNIYIEMGKNSGNSVYQITGSPQPPKENNTDVAYINEGYITITPLHYDLTNFHFIKKLNNLLF